MTQTKMLSVKQFAEEVGLTTRTVYDLVRSGKVPARKLGHKWLIPRKFMSLLEDTGLNQKEEESKEEEKSS